MHPGRWFNETAFDSLDYLVPALLLFVLAAAKWAWRYWHRESLRARRIVLSLLTIGAGCLLYVGRARQASLVAAARWAGLGASRGLASNAVQLDELPRAAGNVAAPAAGPRGPGRRAHGGGHAWEGPTS